MKCKECKEKIPDNTKYCPECGALLNNIKYDIYKTNTYDPTPQQPDYEVRPKYTAPKTTKKDVKKNPVLISIAIFVIISVIAFSFALFESLESEDYFYEDAVISNEYEDRATDYIQNFFETDIRQDYNDFNFNTTIDWDYLCADLPGYSGVEEIYDTLNEDFKDFCKTTVNELFPEDLNIAYMEYNITSSSLLSEYELDTYIEILNSKLSPYGLTAEDYLDYEGIENIYEVEMVVNAIDDNYNIISDSQFYHMIIVESYGFFDVLYDDYFIENFLASVMPVNEESTL